MRSVTRSPVLCLAGALVAGLIILSLMVGCGGVSSSSNNTPGPSPSPTPSPTPGPTPSPTPTPTPQPSGNNVSFVYVGAFAAAPGGQLFGFSVSPDAVLHAVPGSPYSGLSGSPVTNSAFVFASDGTDIQTWVRASDGSLTKGPVINGVAHNDTPSGSGVGSLTLDQTGQSLYAAEINFQGTDNNAYTAFSVGSGGALNFVGNTGINVNAGGPLAFSPNNLFGYSQGCFFIDWSLFGYARQANGALQAISTRGDPPNISNSVLCPLRSAVSAQNVLAVAIGVEGNGGVTPTDLATYAINSDGTLTLNAASLTTNVVGPVVAFDPTGRFLAVGGTGGVQVYSLGSGGVLTAMAPAILSQVTDLQWDKANHLYAISGTSLFVLNFANGALSVANGSPVTVPVQSTMVVLPTT